MTSKPIKAWCVFDEDSVICMETMRKTRTQSIKRFMKFFMSTVTWRMQKRQGYTCREVEIREVTDE